METSKNARDCLEKKTRLKPSLILHHEQDKLDAAATIEIYNARRHED